MTAMEKQSRLEKLMEVVENEVLFGTALLICLAPPKTRSKFGTWSSGTAIRGTSEEAGSNMQ